MTIWITRKARKDKIILKGKKRCKENKQAEELRILN